MDELVLLLEEKDALIECLSNRLAQKDKQIEKLIFSLGVMSKNCEEKGEWLDEALEMTFGDIEAFCNCGCCCCCGEPIIVEEYNCDCDSKEIDE